MDSHFLPRTFFAVATLLLAVLFCYLGLDSNDSLLGRDPSIVAYVGAILLSSSYFSLPLLFGMANSYFIEVQKLPWLALTVVALGALADASFGKSFLSLLIFPFNLVACWVLVSRCRGTKRKFPAISMFVIGVCIVLGTVVGFWEFTNHRAEQMARAFCESVNTGEEVDRILERTQTEGKRGRSFLSIDEFKSLENPKGSIDLSYRGVNDLARHDCHIDISQGVVTGASYSLR